MNCQKLLEAAVGSAVQADTKACTKCQEYRPLSDFYKCSRNKDVPYRSECKACYKIARLKRMKDNYFSVFCSGKKQQSSQKNIPFNLTPEYLEDISVGDCPIFHIPIYYGSRVGQHNRDNQASLDRINPNEGYIIGNVQWISYRANRIKSDATIEELEMITNYLKGLDGR